MGSTVSRAATIQATGAIGYEFLILLLEMNIAKHKVLKMPLILQFLRLNNHNTRRALAKSGHVISLFYLTEQLFYILSLALQIRFILFRAVDSSAAI